MFKSALMPSRLTFLTTTGQEYVAIFKHGDDLRQDQLILQIITLMDKLLRRENLDLKLTPYRVLATSSKHGIIFYITIKKSFWPGPWNTPLVYASTLWYQSIDLLLFAVILNYWSFKLEKSLTIFLNVGVLIFFLIVIHLWNQKIFLFLFAIMYWILNN